MKMPPESEEYLLSAKGRKCLHFCQASLPGSASSSQ
jgi:hypothetical protein